MERFLQLSNLFVLMHAVIFIAVSIRVIMQRRPVGISLAWLITIFALPLVGALFYLLIGERHMGKKRARRAEALLEPYDQWLKALHRQDFVERCRLGAQGESLNRLVQAAIGLPAMAGNRLQLLHDAETILRSIIADIDRARHTCHMEFYIWNAGGTADAVCEALIRAAKRGVICRVLVDAVGSAKFLKSPWTRRLRDSGIELQAALPVGLVRMLFVRLDLRLHRKIVVIDGEMAYTGSLNLVDPRYFKQEAGVGQWVDAMVRLEGPAVQALGVLFLWDWEVETGQGLDKLTATSDLKTLPHVGTAGVQVVPSGPGYRSEAVHQLLLMAIYTARRELIMTTPYFVPDEALLSALQLAALRGVALTIILPARVDSLLVRYASRSYFEDLLEAGAKIFRFKQGLLHTKSITVDGKIALFGTVNLDMRSFWLDFEVTLCVYDADFGQRLRELQQQYLADSEPVHLESWRRRPGRQRFIENTAQLFGPLL